MSWAWACLGFANKGNFDVESRVCHRHPMPPLSISGVEFRTGHQAKAKAHYEALSVILSPTCRMFNDTLPDRVQITTPLTVSGPTVVRKGLLEQLIRTRSNGKV